MVWPKELEVSSREDNGERIRELRMPEGTLTSTPTKRLVTSLKEVNLYRRIWEDAQFVERDDTQAYEEINSIIGEDGIAARFWRASTIPQLLQYEMGVQNFYYLLSDHPEEMEMSINTIHERELKLFR